MVVNVALAQTSATAGTVPALPAFVGTDSQGYLDADGAFSSSAPATIYGKQSGVQDTTTGVYTRYTHEYVDRAGNPVAVGSVASNFVRYCEYPGQRLFKKVKFEVNGNPLDEYSAEAYMFHQKFKVAPNKMTGWKRLMGQEVPIEAVSDLLSVAGASTYAAAATGLTDINGAAVTGGAVAASVTARKLHQVLCGPQTPQAVQPQLEMWIPLIFW
jgi:hypothetical protein